MLVANLLDMARLEAGTLALRREPHDLAGVVDTAIAALLGVSSTVQTFYQKSIFPQWNVNVDRRFQHADLSFKYQSGITA